MSIFICIAKRGSKGRSRTDACSPPPYNSLLSLQKDKAYAKEASKKFPDPEQPHPFPGSATGQVYSMNFKILLMPKLPPLASSSSSPAPHHHGSLLWQTSWNSSSSCFLYPVMRSQKKKTTMEN